MDRPEREAPGWQTVTAELDSGELGGGGHWPHPPVKLGLHTTPGSTGAVDVDDLSLKTADGQELLANGDFSQGAQRWLFVTDQDLAWHIHELWVELYFAQGPLGILALVLLLTAAGMALWPAFRAVEPLAVGLMAGLLGILAVGLLGSVLDTARLAMLLYLGALVPAGSFRHTLSPRRGQTDGRYRGGSPATPL